VRWAPSSDLGWGSRPKLHGMQGVKAWIGLAVPGRPIGPWSRDAVATCNGPDRLAGAVYGPSYPARLRNTQVSLGSCRGWSARFESCQGAAR
jgi:hypothetical protein